VDEKPGAHRSPPLAGSVEQGIDKRLEVGTDFTVQRFRVFRGNVQFCLLMPSLSVALRNTLQDRHEKYNHEIECFFLPRLANGQIPQ